MSNERPESDAMILAFRGPGALLLAISAPVPYAYVYEKHRKSVTAVEATCSGDQPLWLAEIMAWIEAHETPTKSERPDLWAADKLSAARVAVVKLRALLFGQTARSAS